MGEGMRSEHMFIVSTVGKVEEGGTRLREEGTAEGRACVLAN